MSHLTPEHIAAAFTTLVQAGCQRPFGREAPTETQKIEEWSLYVEIIGADVTRPMLAAAVLAWLRDPKTARVWPTAADLRARALNFRPEGVEHTPDDNSAFGIVREYVRHRGAHYWPGAWVLRKWLEQQEITPEAMAQRIAEGGDRHLAGYLSGLLTGRMRPDGRCMLSDLARYFPADVVQGAADRSVWARLAELHKAPIAEAARSTGDWLRWVLLTHDEEAAHRAAFRPIYAALVARQQADQHNRDAAQLLGVLGAGLLTDTAQPRGIRQLVDAGEPRPLFEMPGASREAVRVARTSANTVSR